MLGNVFLTFYRITTRHPLYAALDLLGLSFGVAVFVTLSLYVRFETSFESWIPDADQIYEAQTRYTMPGKPTRSMDASTGMLMETLRSDYPDLVGTRFCEIEADVRRGNSINREREILADANLFRLLDLPLIAGDKIQALEPGKVMLTETMARKYFGRADAVGEQLRLSDSEGPATYVVSAVLRDLPRSTDGYFGIVRMLTPALISARGWGEWGKLPMQTLLRFPDAAAAGKQEALFDDFVDRHLGQRDNGLPMHTFFTWRLVPLRSLHLHDPNARSALVTLGLVGIVSLVMAAVNHVNLATALAGMRAREVAVRRTLGGTRRALAAQFLLEAMLTSLLAWIGGLSLVELALPALNAAAGLSLSLSYAADGVFFASMMAAVILLGLLSGIYPAFVLSRFRPAQVLAANRTPSGGRLGVWVREALVMLQFTVVAVFFTLTWGFFSQIHHLKSADLGFNREGLLVTKSTDDAGMTPALQRQIWAAARQVPGVVSVGSGEAWPGHGDRGQSRVVLTAPERPDIQVSGLRSAVEVDFFAAYGANLLAGRLLDPALPADGAPAAGAPWHIVLNARMLHQLGFGRPEDAVGKTLDSYGKPFEVVGVVGDMRFQSPKTEQEGVYYYISPDRLSRQATAIRYQGVSESEMRARLAAAWRSVAPDIPLELSSADDSLDEYYAPDRIRSRLFGIAAAGAALIGCLGLYGMAAFGTSRRMLELAIRKVLGATRGTVVKLLVGRFLRPVLLSNLLAAPIAYWALAQWLVQFEDRIAITPAPFLLAGGFVVAISLATVAAMSYTAASREPGRILRNE